MSTQNVYRLAYARRGRGREACVSSEVLAEVYLPVLRLLSVSPIVCVRVRAERRAIESYSRSSFSSCWSCRDSVVYRCCYRLALAGDC